MLIFNSNPLTINILPVPDMDDRNNTSLVVNVIDYAVIPHPNPPSVAGREFQASVWAWALGKAAYCVNDTFIDTIWQLRQLFLRAPQYKDGIISHQARLISETACSNGTASSPEAFAAS